MTPIYFKKLKAHPGKGIATAMTILGAFAGAANENMGHFEGALFGAAVMGIVCWGIVLWTARTQPIDER